MMKLKLQSFGLTHLKRPWCWERLKAGEEGDDRGWDGWMASLTWWTWVWVNSGSWWWTGRPGVLQSMGSQRIGHNWATEPNWTVLGLVAVRAFSRCSEQGLTTLPAEHRLSSCVAWALLLVGFSGTRIELESPALTGGFFTTEPPGKPSCRYFWKLFLSLALTQARTAD